MNKKVAILIGSETDRLTMEAADKYYEFFGIEYGIYVKSAHRNPSDVEDFAKNARKNGYATLVGAAGMAAHLSGVLKAHSTLPVIGIPLPGGIQDGLDALMSTLQMPKGVPVATMSVGKAGAINAAVLCAEIFAIFDEEVHEKLIQFKNNGCKI